MNLDVAYDFTAGVTRQQIEAGPPSIWRYAPLLPVPAAASDRPTDLGPGWTRQPSVDSRRGAR